MAYLVNIAARAERDLAALYREIDAESSAAARKWYAGLKQAILDLEKQPYLWPATREAPRLRHILYGHRPHRVYRVIYRVLEKRKTVVVLHIRHGARQAFGTSDLRRDGTPPSE
ncbi:MAG: type II toxin-antitoxin system RelE/ParE family toxin [Terracidiphilus sp.]